MVWSRIAMLSGSTSLRKLDLSSIWMSNDDDVIVDNHRRNVFDKPNNIVKDFDRFFNGDDGNNDCDNVRGVFEREI